MLIGTIAIVAVLLLAGFAIAGPLGAPWVPAYRRDVADILEDTKLKKGQLYIELGSGDGRLLAEAAKRGARVIGYEINPFLWVVAWLRIRHYPEAHVYLGSFWNKDISAADVVMAFLMPKFMARLEAKVKKELKPGALFVSYIFKLPTLQPVISRTRWYIYKNTGR